MDLDFWCRLVYTPYSICIISGFITISANVLGVPRNKHFNLTLVVPFIKNLILYFTKAVSHNYRNYESSLFFLFFFA